MESITTPTAQILIVEDEKIIAKDLEIRLKRMGYQVVGSVTNGPDCLALLQGQNADLILMDIMIDGPMDGIDTAHQVRGLHDIPIIFLTAYADESTFQRAKLSDPFGYILKPFQERELNLSIETVLQKHSLERRLRDNENRYRLLFESTQEAILVLDDEAALVDANAATELLFGRKKEEMLGQSILLLAGNDAEESFASGWAEMMSQQSGQGQQRVARPDGQVRYVDYSVRMQYQPGRHLAVLRDITQKRFVEQQLTLSEQHLKAIFDNSIQSFILLDLEFKVVAFNRQAERWVADLGFKRLRKGLPGTQVWPTNHSGKLKNFLRAAAEGEVLGYEDLFEYEGKNVWLEISLVPVRDAHEHITGVCITALDISERKLNEQSLAQSEARYRSLVQNSSDLVMLIDREGSIEYVSESSIRITGYKPSELIGNRITKYVHERDKLRMVDGLRKAVDKEEANIQLEYRFLKADGQLLTIESLFTNELDNKAIHAVVLNSRDITERKLAEDGLRNLVRGISPYSGEDYFVFLVDNLAVHLGMPNVALIELTETGELRALAVVKGGNAGQAGALGAASPFAQEVLQNGYLYVSNIQASTFNNDALLSTFQARFALGVAMHNFAGQSMGFLLAAGTEQPLNLSLMENMLRIFSYRAANEFERIKFTHALSASQASLTALVENTDDSIWSIDQAYRLTALNSSFRQRFAYQFADGVEPGDVVLDVMHNEEAGIWRSYYDEAIAGNRTTREIISWHDGNHTDYEVSFNPILSEEQLVTGVSIFARDITERKRAENELKRTNFELDSFVYRASHDLRAPLRSVLGLVNLIKGEKADNLRANYLALAEKSINKLDTFISDLTHFSRNTRLEVQAEIIDIEGLIHECLENLRYMENAEKVKSLLEIDDHVPFRSDPQRIAIILQNLVSNAIKYQRTSPDSYVKIRFQPEGTQMHIAVEDNGKGIDAEYLPRIFEMFFRASAESYGSGLGLYITQQVVEKLQGTIRVESEIGAGTRFYITLPNMPEPENAD